MLNQVIVIGRLVRKPILEENEKGIKVTVITLAVSRCFKNEYGLYDTDFIKCILWSGIAENTTEYCEKGDLVAIKGRLECLDGNLHLIAEKVTFLASNKTNNSSNESLYYSEEDSKLPWERY